MLPTAGVVSRETVVGGESRKRGMESPRPAKVRRCGFGRVKAHLKLRGCWGSAAAGLFHVKQWGSEAFGATGVVRSGRKEPLRGLAPARPSVPYGERRAG